MVYMETSTQDESIPLKTWPEGVYMETSTQVKSIHFFALQREGDFNARGVKSLEATHRDYYMETTDQNK